MDPGFFNIPEYDVNTYIKSSEGFIPGINTEQVTNHYNQWSNTYEKVDYCNFKSLMVIKKLNLKSI